MSVSCRLAELAFARSGDKGDVCNIGVMAKSPKLYPVLVEQLTPERIQKYFAEIIQGPVEVYPVPTLEAFNVVIRRALGGGATRTLRFDQTGKSMAAAALRMEIEVPEAVLAEAREISARIAKTGEGVMGKTLVVNAPLSGIYYEASSPGEEPFVREGQKISDEDIVALIESMKVFVEVRAEVKGTVKRLLVKNEQLVQSGQPMLEVEG